MQIRFIDAPQFTDEEKLLLKRCDGVCAACGFGASSGFRCYTEEDGVQTVACGPCFAFRHALDADSDLYMVGWIPEISQADLAHLTRVIAVILMRYPVLEKPKTIVEAPAELRQRSAAKSIVAALRSRVSGAMTVALSQTTDGLVSSLVEKVPADGRGPLLAGLRMLPIAFEEDEVSGWLNDDSSLNGYGSDLLKEQDWFAADLLLQPVSPAALRASWEDTEDQKGVAAARIEQLLSGDFDYAAREGTES